MALLITKIFKTLATINEDEEENLNKIAEYIILKSNNVNISLYFYLT